MCDANLNNERTSAPKHADINVFSPATAKFDFMCEWGERKIRERGWRWKRRRGRRSGRGRSGIHIEVRQQSRFDLFFNGTRYLSFSIHNEGLKEKGKISRWKDGRDIKEYRIAKKRIKFKNVKKMNIEMELRKWVRTRLWETPRQFHIPSRHIHSFCDDLKRWKSKEEKWGWWVRSWRVKVIIRN